MRSRSIRLVAAVLGTVTLLGAGCSVSQTADRSLGAPNAPSFQARTPSGQPVHFDTTTAMGRQAILLFYRPGCAVCEAEMPRLARLHQTRPDVLVIGIPTASYEPHAANVPAFPVVLDPDRTLAARYRITETPTVVVIQEGRISYAAHRLPAVPFDVRLASR